MTDTRTARCQAAGGVAYCTDPKCPEKVGIQNAYATAVKNNDFDAYAKAKELEKRSFPKPTTIKNGFTSQFPVRPKPQPPVARMTQQVPVRTAPGQEALYHKEMGFPTGFSEPTGARELEYSRHALEAAEDDRYGKIFLPKSIKFEDFTLIEMGVADGNRVTKMLYRGDLDDELDICIVVKPKGKGQKWFVKTVWINEKKDKHRTLDRSKYMTPVARREAA